MVAPYFHTALLVPSLEDAIVNLGRKLAIEFTTPVTAHCENFVEYGSRRVLDLGVAYSRTPEPYVELIEAHPSGIYSASAGLGYHHLGVWESDCEARVKQLTDTGVELEAVQYDPDGRIIVAYFAPAGLNGLRYELVDEGRRAMMENWIAGGEFVDYV